jgi:micrococcal nuclease
MCYGPDASTFTESYLEGEQVQLEFGVERTDRYGRTLAYIWLDGELFNKTPVACVAGCGRPSCGHSPRPP